MKKLIFLLLALLTISCATYIQCDVTNIEIKEKQVTEQIDTTTIENSKWLFDNLKN